MEYFRKIDKGRPRYEYDGDGETILSSVSNLTRLDFSVDSLKFLEKIGNETRSIRGNRRILPGKESLPGKLGLRKRSIHCIIWKRLMRAACIY